MGSIKCSLFEGRSLLDIGSFESDLWNKYIEGFTTLATTQVDIHIQELFTISGTGGVVCRHEENKM